MARLREHAERVRNRLADDTGAATAEYAIATMAIVVRLEHTCDHDPGDRKTAARRNLRTPIRR